MPDIEMQGQSGNADEGSHRGQKRQRSNTDADQSEAKRMRALVRRKDEAHRAIETYYDAASSSSATTISALHLAICSPQKVPGFTVAPIKRFEFKPRALLVSSLLAYNGARSAWKVAAERAAESPDSFKPMLVIPLGWTHKKDELADMAGTLTRATCSILQVKGVSVIPPQAAQDSYSPYPNVHGPPYAFFLNGLSIEAGRDAAAGHAFCARADDGRTLGVCYVEWDLAPKSHVGTLKGMETLADDSPERITELEGLFGTHVASRRPQIEYVVTAYAAHHWGTELPKNWFDIFLASLKIDVLIDEASGKGKRAVHVNVYALGLFTEHDACQKWSAAILGESVNFGIYGFGTPLKKSFVCAYCHETDHHVRLCRILRHPLWFHKPEIKVDYAIPDEDDDKWKKPASKPKPGKNGGNKGKGKGKGKPS